MYSLEKLVRGNLPSSVCWSRPEKSVCSWSFRELRTRAKATSLDSHPPKGSSTVGGTISSGRLSKKDFINLASCTWLITLPSLCWAFLGVVDSPHRVQLVLPPQVGVFRALPVVLRPTEPMMGEGLLAIPPPILLRALDGVPVSLPPSFSPALFPMCCASPILPRGSAGAVITVGRGYRRGFSEMLRTFA